MGVSAATIIDGYNFLHTTGILGKGRGPGGLERARKALLNFLAAALDPAQREATVVVFDSKESPPGCPPVAHHQGITVHYASGYDDADALIQELIRRHSAPKRLTVVSSDRAVQRAAKRRRARAVGSEAWYEELLRQPREAGKGSTVPDSTKPAAPITPEEVEQWLDQFAGPAGDAEVAPPGGEPAATNPPQPPDVACEAAGEELQDPFPPEYVEEIEKELRSGDLRSE